MQNVNPDLQLWGRIRIEFEGIKLKAYLDSGKIWTIGFGTTFLYDKNRRVIESDVITMEQAIQYMSHDSSETIRLANVYIKKSLNVGQSTAICDYIYNRGIGNFLKTNLDELINVNPNDLRIVDIIKKTGLRDKLGNLLNGLIRRRKCQAYLYQTGNLKIKF